MGVEHLLQIIRIASRGSDYLAADIKIPFLV
jgi:hypothetical protein